MPGKSNLIVTGLSGMIGNRFEELYGHKFNFTNIDLSTNIDISDGDKVSEAIQNAEGDIILHLAAFTDVNKAHEQNGDKNGSVYQVNVVGTDNLIAAAKKYKKHLIMVSTDYVFSGEKNKPYTEDDPVSPIEWYGETKAMAEDHVRSKLDTYSILRTSFPFRSQFEPKKDIVRNIIAKLEDGSLPPQFTDNFITPTFIDDLCKVFFMFTLKRPRGVYHATGSSWLSSYELAEKVKEVFELKGKVEKGSLEEYLKTAKRPYQKSVKMTNAKLQEELGNPMLTVESALMIMKTQM